MLLKEGNEVREMSYGPLSCREEVQVDEENPCKALRQCCPFLLAAVLSFWLSADSGDIELK